MTRLGGTVDMTGLSEYNLPHISIQLLTEESLDGLR
jgi:hypothetical protein